MLLGANVTALEVDDAGTSIEQVAVSTLDGHHFSVTAKTFVLAAGGIENPRLLLASNTRLPEGIGNQNDLVGRYFLEHPRFDAGVLLPFDGRGGSFLFYNDHDVDGKRIECYLALSRGLQQRRSSERYRFVSSPRMPARSSVPSSRMKADSFPGADVGDRRPRHRGRRREPEDRRERHDDLAELRRRRRTRARSVPRGRRRGARRTASAGELQARLPDFLGDAAAVAYRAMAPAALVESVRLISRIEPIPNPDSRVKLTSERDALGMPQAELDWRLTRFDRRSARRTLEILAAEVGRAGIGRVKVIVQDDDSPWPDDLAGGWHLIGTTRMSDDPKQGVVDRDLRVHGIENLYVTGSSVFPTSGSGTPTLTLVALTLPGSAITCWVRAHERASDTPRFLGSSAGAGMTALLVAFRPWRALVEMPLRSRCRRRGSPACSGIRTARVASAASTCGTPGRSFDCAARSAIAVGLPGGVSGTRRASRMRICASA